MSVRSTIGTVTHHVEGVARGTVGAAVAATHHPIGTAARAAGLAKGLVEFGLGLVRVAQPSSPVTTPVPEQSPAQREEAAPPARTSPSEPERDLPGADIVLAPVPDPDDLPEPIVIEADDTPGEAFHTEPKAGSRESEHGAGVGDREEVEGYDEEVVLPDEPDEADEPDPSAVTPSDVADRTQ